MFTDDADTLDKGGKKIEVGFVKSGLERVHGLSGGFSPIDNVELGLNLQHARDRSIPDFDHAVGLHAKWIHLKSGIFSAGIQLDYARAQSGGGHAKNSALGAEAPVANKGLLTLDIDSGTGSDIGKQIGAH